MYINRDKIGLPKPEKKEKKKTYTLKKTKPKPVAKKRAKQLTKYSKLRIKFLEENPICCVCRENLATEVHHAEGKENELLLKVESFRPICRPCHTRITEHSAEAIEKGYSILRTAA